MVDKLNLEITHDLLKQNRESKKRLQAMINRNTACFEHFKDYIKEPILEVGCREGVLMNILLSNGYHSFGVDISEEAIKNNIINTTAVGEAENLPFPDGYFNTVLCIHTLEHIPNTRKAANEIYRVLKIGGYALIEVPIQKKEKTPTKWGHWFCFSNEKEILNMFPALSAVKIIKKDKKPWRRVVFKK